MLKLSDKDSALKADELEKIIEAMSSLHGGKLKDLKKGPAAMSVEVTHAEPLEDGEEGMDLGKPDAEEAEEPAEEIAREEEGEDAAHSPEEGMSEHDKGMIAALYDRFCK